MRITLLTSLVLLAWLGWTYYSSGNLETPRYTVLDERDGFELRRYDGYIVAQVQVEGDRRQALNRGFQKLAGYIFGGNSGGDKVAMTAPVTEREGQKIAMTAPVTESRSETIAMTAPVTEREAGGRYTIGFMMPSEFTLDSLPRPNDPDVEFVEQPPTLRAVTRFSGLASDARVDRFKQALAEQVSESELEAIGEPVYAAYNDPFSFPLLRRHEIWIEVEGGDLN